MVNVYACLLSAFTSLAMMGLFNVRYRLEDPFCGDISSEKAESNLARRCKLPQRRLKGSTTRF